MRSIFKLASTILIALCPNFSYSSAPGPAVTIEISEVFAKILCALIFLIEKKTKEYEK